MVIKYCTPKRFLRCLITCLSLNSRRSLLVVLNVTQSSNTTSQLTTTVNRTTPLTTSVATTVTSRPGHTSISNDDHDTSTIPFWYWLTIAVCFLLLLVTVFTVFMANKKAQRAKKAPEGQENLLHEQF